MAELAMTDAQFCERATIILKHLALERTGWRRWLLGRWYISDEPLRNDAANLLRAARWHVGLYPIHTRFVGEKVREQRG